MIYFDHNATGPLHPVAREAWVQASEKFIGNPSSLHRLGSRADAAVETARAEVAGWLGCNAADVIWTSGASEANNLVIHHFARSVNARRDELWISAIEHPSVLEPARHYFGKKLRLIPVTRDGRVDLDWVSDAFKGKRPVGVAALAANNETGVLQPWSLLAKLCHEHVTPFFSDAVQWMGRIPGNGLAECDFVSASAHKFGGPKGVGFLRVPSAGPIHRLFHGGPQEFGRRAGTENVPGILAMAAVLKVREESLRAQKSESLYACQVAFETRLLKRLPGLEIVGEKAPRLWNTTMAIMPETAECFRWVVKLDKAGFAVSTGSACSSGEEKPSHVLSAMGCTPGEISRTIRISAGWETTSEEYDGLLDAIKTVALEKKKARVS